MGKNVECYKDYFEDIKKLLPKRLIKTFLKYNGFHDYIIKSITISSLKRKQKSIHCIVINIENYKNSFMLTYHGVKNYNISVPNVDNWIFSEMCWGYTEFSITENCLIRQNILCDINSEIEIECNNIIITKKDNAKVIDVMNSLETIPIAE